MGAGRRYVATVGPFPRTNGPDLPEELSTRCEVAAAVEVADIEAVEVAAVVLDGRRHFFAASAKTV